MHLFFFKFAKKFTKKWGFGWKGGVGDFEENIFLIFFAITIAFSRKKCYNGYNYEYSYRKNFPQMAGVKEV